MVSTANPLSVTAAALRVRRLGAPGVLSPMASLLQGRVSSPHWVHEADRVLLDDTPDQSCGFQTAFARATDSIKSAHTEASSTPTGSAWSR